MKRIHRTLTAAALAGSLALGGTAVASAQIPAPAVFELDGTTYQRQADGTYKSTNPLGSVSLTAEQAQAAWERLQEKEAPADNPAEDPAVPVDPDPQDNAPAPANPDPAPAGPSKVDTPIDNGSDASKNDPEKPEAGGEQPEAGNENPKAGEDKDKPVTPPSGETDPTGDSQPPAGSAEDSDFDAKQLAWLALPAALVIGGVTWYLAKDGKTYVKSQEAAQNDAPSAEEKAASEQMLKENKDEVIAQGGQVAESTAEKSQVQSRGISAETGSNTVARGLAALAIAAMIAAGAFAARRKFFI